MSLRIIHIAPFNTSGVPMALVKAERKLGHYSRLVTLGRDLRHYEEDICLDLPFMNSWATRLAKRIVVHPDRLSVHNNYKMPETIPPVWQPNGPAEKIGIALREWLWKRRIEQLFESCDFWNFDIYQLDGGLEFFRNGQTIKKLKALHKKVICCYTGSDLRTRGVLPNVDALTDLNVTLEFDHLKLHEKIHHVFFPFDVSRYELRAEPEGATIRIGHAPTNRAAKGSEVIISAIQELQSEFSVDLELIENLPHEEALKRKARCHIFVDQIGMLGYGINSLEALAMGIPTCSCLAPGFEKEYSDHPFIVIDASNIKARLRELVRSRELRQAKGSQGRHWVQTHHDSLKVVQKIHALAGLT
ncbi:MAG: glycosyltransferase [bacterium]